MILYERGVSELHRCSSIDKNSFLQMIGAVTAPSGMPESHSVGVCGQAQKP